eukprot:TRINITY_DN18367_c0_g1_i1.p1 TRINITY_DN18367_c0_g1~~TRINITY_DN18367_c0_g1_i1.p1  ORF type:complete len:808 (+),score=103.48 TRINITY_DN18367_c0_g1_i1:103-2526(+)
METVLLHENHELGRVLWLLAHGWGCLQLWMRQSTPLDLRLRVAWWSTLPLAMAVCPARWLKVGQGLLLQQRPGASAITYFGMGLCSKALAASEMVSTRRKVEMLWSFLAAAGLVVVERSRVAAMLRGVSDRCTRAAQWAVALLAPLGLCSSGAFSARDDVAEAATLLFLPVMALVAVIALGTSRPDGDGHEQRPCHTPPDRAFSTRSLRRRRSATAADFGRAAPPPHSGSPRGSTLPSASGPSGPSASTGTRTAGGSCEVSASAHEVTPKSDGQTDLPQAGRVGCLPSGQLSPAATHMTNVTTVPAGSAMAYEDMASDARSALAGTDGTNLTPVCLQHIAGRGFLLPEQRTFSLSGEAAGEAGNSAVSADGSMRGSQSMGGYKFPGESMPPDPRDRSIRSDSIVPGVPPQYQPHREGQISAQLQLFTSDLRSPRAPLSTTQMAATTVTVAAAWAAAASASPDSPGPRKQRRRQLLLETIAEEQASPDGGVTPPRETGDSGFPTPAVAVGTPDRAVQRTPSESHARPPLPPTPGGGPLGPRPAAAPPFIAAAAAAISQTSASPGAYPRAMSIGSAASTPNLAAVVHGPSDVPGGVMHSAADSPQHFCRPSPLAISAQRAASAALAAEQPLLISGSQTSLDQQQGELTDTPTAAAGLPPRPPSTSGRGSRAAILGMARSSSLGSGSLASSPPPQCPTAPVHGPAPPSTAEHYDLVGAGTMSPFPGVAAGRPAAAGAGDECSLGDCSRVHSEGASSSGSGGTAAATPAQPAAEGQQGQAEGQGRRQVSRPLLQSADEIMSGTASFASGMD